MMASAPQPFPHGGMPGHGGMQHGHPMGPGHPVGQGMPSGGQPGVSMAQPMHGMGGNPQVSQGGPMVGMPQGGGPGVSVGGPSAHALSHLNPTAHPALYQQQQQQQQMALQNPQLMQHQMRIRQQQQQQQQQMMAMAQHQNQHGGNMVMNGVNPGMGIPNMPNLPAHLQQQLHAQQQVQQAQQAQQQARVQQMQLQQHLQQQQQQQQIQMQNAGHGPSGQPTPQAPIRPQSVMQNQSDQQGMPQPQAQHPPQGPQQGQPQVPQQHAQQQPQNQPQQQPQQGQNPQGPPNMPQQVGPQVQGQPQGQPGQLQQVARQNMQHQAQINAMRQQQQQMMRPQGMINTLRGQSTLKLFNFADQLSACNTAAKFENTMKHWYEFVFRHFGECGVLRQRIYNVPREGEGGTESKDFEFTIGLIPRYYYASFANGVQQMQMIIEGAQEKELPHGGSLVECPRASTIYWYADGHQVIMNGVMRVQFDASGRIDLMEHNVEKHQEYISRATLLEQPQSPEPVKLSPTMTKNKKGQQPRAKPVPSEPKFTIPPSAIGNSGITDRMFLFFEVAEVFSQMDGLFAFYEQHQNKNQNLSPPEALRQLVASQGNNNNNNNGNPNMPNDSMPFNPAFNTQNAGQRTPGAGFTPNGPQQFQSPAPGAHLNLPVNTNSPANMNNMSPAMQQNTLQGNPMNQPQPNSVAMAHQLSQQGSATGSQGTSANTSPHVTNKKRRASQVKTEMDGDTEVNGKVKQSPRVGGKRQKPA